MEVDDFQKQVSKFQRVSSNGSSTTTTDNSQKIISQNNHHVIKEGGGGNNESSKLFDVGLGVGRLCGWPTSRIVRVSRASGGKDRHSKVLTSKGLRDRRVRLSVSTAIQFYDLQDRLGYDQPSKAVEWLLKAASTSIDELPSLDPCFMMTTTAPDYCMQQQLIDVKSKKDIEEDYQNRLLVQNNNDDVLKTKSPACSSTSETSKGSGLSLSNRSENRIKARERAREMASKKEKDKETDEPKSLNPAIENSSFTDLLTGGTSRHNSEARTHWSTPQMDYFQIPQFSQQQTSQQQHFAFLQDGGESYNLNFSMTTPLSSNNVAPGFSSRGTLQSNLSSTTNLLPHHHLLQRFHSSVDNNGSTSSGNMPFFIVPNPGSDHFPNTYHLSYGNGPNSDHHKEKSKN